MSRAQGKAAFRKGAAFVIAVPGEAALWNRIVAGLRIALSVRFLYRDGTPSDKENLEEDIFFCYPPEFGECFADSGALGKSFPRVPDGYACFPYAACRFAFGVRAVFITRFPECRVGAGERFSIIGGIMDPYYAGWMSLLPPVTAIVLALITKEVVSSLLIGIFTGTFIYSMGTGADFVVMSTIESAFAIMVKRLNFDIIMFCSALGGLVYVISMAGGSRAYGRWATSRIRSRRTAMLSTSGLGGLIFIDDYFNCLTVGTVMKPVTDAYGVSRAKLAYIIDSTAAPICIIAPISSWAAAVGSNLKSTGAFESEISAFIAAIPYNFYSLLSITLVVLLCLFKWDFGPMRAAEKRAAEGNLGILAQQSTIGLETKNGNVFDMLIPIGSLIVFAVLAMMYSGGYWGSDPQYHNFRAALGNCNASPSLVWASFGGLLVALLLYVPRRLMSLAEFMHGVVEGMKAMLTANLILVLAWGISGVCQDMLQTNKFVEAMVTDGNMVGAMLPFIIFIVAGFLSFSTGTAWGSFGILIPLVVPVAQAICPELLVVALSATLAGSVFGDHCSPISDTTILSSAGAGCSHIEHVSTQLPYALLAAGCSAAGYLVAGFVTSNPWICLLASGGLLVAALLVLNVWYNRKEAGEA